MAKRKVLYDASDEAQVNEVKRDIEDREKDLGFILSEPRGRRWIYEFIHDTCHVERISHVPRDTHSTAYNEGGRAVGTTLLASIREHHVKEYFKMLEENENV